MNKIKRVKISDRENKIDDILEEQALTASAWGKETEVSPRLKPTSIRLSTRTIQRAKIFARIHRQRGYQSWLKRVIEERIDNEYEIYQGLRNRIGKQS